MNLIANRNLPFQVFAYPHMPYGLVRLGVFSVQIDRQSLAYGLNNPDELLSELQSALATMDDAQAGNSIFRRVPEVSTGFTILNGNAVGGITKRVFTERNTGHHISVITRDLLKNEDVGINNYISIERHNEIIQEVKASALTSIHTEIAKGVQTGVTKGIQSGIAKVAETLGEIKSQKEALQKQLAILERKEKRIEEQERRKAANRPRSTVGFVYVLQADNGYFKIGRTSNPDNRLKTFNVKLPFEVEYTLVIPTPDMYALEYDLHTHFASKRVNGEWFNLEESDLEYMKGLQS